MPAEFSRRNLLKTLAPAAILPSLVTARTSVGMAVEGPDTPKICAPIQVRDISDASIRRVKQIGVNYVLSGGPKIPWDESELQSITEKLKAGGLTLGNLMIGGFPNAIYGRPGRDEEIEKVRTSIRVAGKAGIAVVEYNFYAHRDIEGYYEETGRAGAGLTAFDYERVKDLPPLPEEGAHTLDEMWSNIAYFLRAVVPVAEESHVRLALHPNDPPAPISRGSGQIMGTVDGWKKLIDIVPSPANGITFDCGVTREMGQNPVEVCRYFAAKDRINHVHYRNVRVRKPYEQYTEVFIDEGENNMFAIMQELVKNKYPRLLYPEHERALDVDRERGIRNQYPGGGGYTGMVYDIAYARAMLQAAMSIAR